VLGVAVRDQMEGRPKISPSGVVAFGEYKQSNYLLYIVQVLCTIPNSTARLA
jgi:hypothetical protein